MPFLNVGKYNFFTHRFLTTISLNVYVKQYFSHFYSTVFQTIWLTILFVSSSKNFRPKTVLIYGAKNAVTIVSPCWTETSHNFLSRRPNSGFFSKLALIPKHRTLWRQWWIWPSNPSPPLCNLTTDRGGVTAKILIYKFWSFNKLLHCRSYHKLSQHRKSENAQ